MKLKLIIPEMSNGYVKGIAVCEKDEIEVFTSFNFDCNEEVKMIIFDVVNAFNPDKPFKTELSKRIFIQQLEVEKAKNHLQYAERDLNNLMRESQEKSKCKEC